MRNHTLVIAITLLICLTSSGKLRAGTADEMARPERSENDARADRQGWPCHKNRARGPSRSGRRLEGKAPDASKPAVSSARIKLPECGWHLTLQCRETAPRRRYRTEAVGRGSMRADTAAAVGVRKISVSPLRPRP